MAAPINNAGAGGRPPGAVNKSTKQAREAIAAFVDNNAERLSGWLDQIAAESPKDAFNCFMDVVEYHIPKLQRALNDEDNAQHHVHTIGLNQSDHELINRYLTQKEKS